MQAFFALLVFTLSVYGLSWLLVFSTLLEYPRKKILSWSSGFFYDLFTCIVCSSVWITFFILIFVDKISIFSNYIVVNNILDVIIWTGYSITTTWIIASLLKEAN